MKKTDLLQVQNISYGVQNLTILNSVSFSIPSNKIFSLVGRSGAGKSSLLKILSGLSEPTDGDVFVNDKKIYGPDYKLIAGHEDIRIIHQDFKLNEFHKVWENIEFALRFFSYENRQERIDELLEVFELTKLKNLSPKMLSGGERQRLAIAIGLAYEPKVLLMDEPFNQIDKLLKIKIWNYIKSSFMNSERSILFVSHETTDALMFSDEILIMQNGNIIQQDSPEKIYYEPNNEYTATLFGEFSTINNNFFRPNQLAISLKKTSDYKIEASVVDTLFTGSYFMLIINISSDLKTAYVHHSTKIKPLTKIWLKAL